VGSEGEKRKDPHAVELGRRGAAARKAKANGYTSELGRRAANARVEAENRAITAAAVAVALNWKPWKRLRKVRGDIQAYIAEEWGRRIPHAYEEVLNAAMEGQPVPPIVLDVLKAMTVMSPLSPERLKQAVAADGFALPSDLDLSQIDNETLEKITGKKLLTPDSV